jgi:hypothetical protein
MGPLQLGEEVICPSTTVTNPPAWLIQLFASLQTAEEDVKLLAYARNDEDPIEIDISHLCDYYEILSKNASELVWQITQDATLENAVIQEHFNMIFQDYQNLATRYRPQLVAYEMTQLAEKTPKMNECTA